MRTEKGKSIDADQYVGMKTKTETAVIELMKFGAVLKVSSVPIPFLGGDELPKGQLLRASRIFSLGVSEVDQSLIILENSKLDRFLHDKAVRIVKDYKIGDHVPELEGVPCIVQKTETGFLELA